MLHKEYQGIVRLSELLGQDMLYIIDPKALNQVVIKEQEICDVSDFELEVIRFSFGRGLLGVTDMVMNIRNNARCLSQPSLLVISRK